MIRIESSAAGCVDLVRRVRLKAELDRVEISNTVNKKRAPLNTHPVEGGPGGDFAQHESKESAQFAYPIAIQNGQIHMEVPLAAIRPEIDQLPGSCKNLVACRPVDRCYKCGVRRHLCALDAPLVEIGYLSATMPSSQTHPEIWRKHVEPLRSLIPE